MYKKLQTKFLALLAIMLMGGSYAWAEEVVYKTALFGTNYNSKGVSSYTATWTATNDGFTVSLANFNNNNNGWNYVKCGSKSATSVATISTSAAIDVAITKVAVTIDAITANNVNSIKLYTSSNNSTWTEAGSFSLETGTKTVTLTTPTANLYYKLEFDCKKGSGNGFVQVSKVEYYYNNTPSTEPSVTVSTNSIDAPADGKEGTIIVTYNNIAEAADDVFFCQADGETTASYDWVTAEVNEDNNVDYIIEANTGEARTAYMKVYALDDETNIVYSELITITQAAAPVAYTTIPALFEAATSTSTPVNVTFGNWVVTGVNGSQLFVTDGTYGFIVYQSDHGFKVGDILSGTASCNLVLFGGSAELTGLTSTTSGLTVETGGSVTPVATTIDALGAVNTGSVVTLSNLTYDGSNLSDGTNTIIPWSTLHTGTYEDGKTYNVTGVFVLNNSSKRILPRSAADIVEVVSVEPSITLSTNTIEATADGANGTITVTYNNITDVEAEVLFYAADGTTSASYDWITAEINNDNNISYQVTANTGDARTAYMKVYALDDNVNDVYSELITITQAAAPGIVDNYELFTGDLVEGDYLIVYDGKAMNTTVTNDRLQYAEVTPINNVITTDDATIVWHIAPSGDNWTIYNAAANAYAASTGAKNKAQMLTDGTDDKALWTVSASEGTYDFVNKKNTDNNVNANLRNNGTYGFACYAAGTGGALSLYKKVEATPEYVTVSISPAGMATFCSDKALDFTAVDAIHAYYVNVDNSGNLTFTRIRKIPANTGVLLRNAQGEDQGAVEAINVPVLSGEADPVDENAFVAVLEEIAQLASNAGGFNNYILNKKDGRLGFYRANDQKVGAGKAYLRIDESIQAREFFGFNEGEATSISTIDNGQLTMENAYNLQGQKVGSEYKGIVIVNGKKFINK